jgi:oxygen-dependent protoporphyrinogen oxidase
VNPFVGGVYAGDPARLSVRHAFPKLHALEQKHGSLIRGAIKRRNTSGGPAGRIFSFPHGLGELPGRLAEILGPSLHLGHTVLAIRRHGSEWQIDRACGSREVSETFSAVICAVPPRALAALAFENTPGAAALQDLRQIEHPPVASVFTGYRREDVAHALNGFGLLVPQIEQRLILGTLFSSTLFPGRAPDGHVALTSFVGGMRAPELAALNENELVRIVHGELEQLVGARAAPVFTHVRVWPHAIPQYTLGYQRYEDAIAGVETKSPGLFVGGNGRDGISLANCIASGARLARAAIHHASTLMPALSLAALAA